MWVISRPRVFTIRLDSEPEGGFSAQCLELPAAISQGETEEETLKNIKEAIELVLEHLQEEVKAEKNQLRQIEVEA